MGWCKVTLKQENINISYNMEDLVEDSPNTRVQWYSPIVSDADICGLECRLREIERRLDILEKIESEKNRVKWMLGENVIYAETNNIQPIVNE